jgi:hypothetical protein
MSCYPIYSGTNPYSSIGKYTGFNPYSEKEICMNILLLENNTFLLMEDGEQIEL